MPELPADGHPSTELLRRFDTGELPGPEAEVIEGHIETCTVCCQRLREMPRDPLLNRPQVVASLGDSEVASFHQLTEPLAPHANAPSEALQALPTPGVPGFQVLDELGRGGMGVVYKAQQIGLGRVVALKMIPGGDSANADLRRRFQAEAEAVAQVQHANIVQIYEVGEHNGLPYFAMELCSGGNLDEQLDGTPWEPTRAAALIATLASGVDAVHQAGVVHRDLKPANVLFTADGTPKVTDFGVAKRVAATSHTQTGAIMGTPSYMPPEQANCSKIIGPAADVYALGAILYELLTGRPPFKAATPLDTVLQMLSEEPVPVRRLQPKVPRDIETISHKCLEKEPGKRYATATALAEDLRRFLGGEPVQARPVGPIGRLAKWARRRPAVAALLALVAVVALAGGTGTLWALGEAVRQRNTADANFHDAAERAEAVERQLYVNRVNLAYRECLANNVAEAERLLDGCPPARRGWEWSYCRRLCHLESLTIPGSADAHGTRLDIAFSPEGTIASANADGTVSLWDAATGREVRTIRAHDAAVFGVTFSPDGHLLATGSLGEVKLWESKSGSKIRSLRGFGERVTCIRFSPDGLWLAAGSATDIEAKFWPGAKVWEVATGREVASVHERHWGNACVAFSPDGRRLASVNEWAPTLSLWDPATGKEIHTVDIKTGEGGFSVAYAPDGRRVALACRDGSVVLWDTTANALIHNLRGHTGVVSDVAFSPDGRLVASASADGSVKLWDATAGREVANYRGHTAPVFRVRFGPGGTRLASMAWDRTIKVWEVAVEPEPLTLRGNRGWAFRTAFSPDGARLVTAGFNVVHVRDVASTQTLTTILRPGGGVQGLALSPDGRQVASSGEFKQTFELHDTETGRLLVTFGGHSGRVRAVAFAPDGRWLASASEDGTVRLWDAASGQEVQVLRGHPHGVFGVAFAPDGDRIASIGWDDTVRLWDTATGQELRALAGAGQRRPPGFGNALAFSPDGRRLAAPGDNGTIVVWDLLSGEVSFVLAGHTGAVNGVAFSHDGRRLVSAADDQTLKLWDAATGEEVFTLRGHRDGVLGVAFSPDGGRIASASADMTVKLWEAVSPTADSARGRRAVALVESLFSKPLLQEDVIKHLGSDPALAEPVRTVALEIARRTTDAPEALNEVSWQVVRESNRPPGEYERALRHAEAACGREPENGTFRSTLGVAQYRAGRYPEALESLTVSNRLNATKYKSSIPADLAFLAMAHHRLGHRTEALTYLGRLREAMKTSRVGRDQEAAGFLGEAKALIGGPDLEGTKR